MFDIARLASASEAEQTGRMVGAAIPIIIVLIGIIKCQQIARRPTTNARAAYGLMLLLIGWLISMIFGILVKQVELSQLTRIGLVTLFLAPVLVGCFLAVFSLAEMKMQPGKYTQGKKQAIWTIVLTVAMFALFIGGLVAGVLKRQSAEDTQIARRSVAVQPVAGERIRFDDLNFYVESPGKPWVRTDPSKVSAVACLSFIRRGPETWFIIIGERFPDPETATNDALITNVKSNLASVAEHHEILSETPYTLDGKPGVRIDANARIDGVDIAYSYLLLAHRGFAYQIMLWTLEKDRPALSPAVEEIAARFHVIDSEIALPVVADLQKRSDWYGYSVNVNASEGWRPWRSMATDFPESDFGAISRSGETCFAVVPVETRGNIAEPDQIAGAFMTLIGMDFNVATDVKPITQATVSGLSFRFVRDLEGTNYTYHARTLSGNGMACLIYSWTSGAAGEPAIDSVLDRVTFSPVSARGIASTPPANAFLRESTWLNKLGLIYYDRSELARAANCFEQAFALRSDDKEILRNAVQARLDLNDVDSALRLVQNHPADFALNPEMRARAAMVYVAAGRSDDAVAIYQKLFDGTENQYRGDVSFDRYITLLSDLGRTDEAIKVAERYVKLSDTVSSARTLAGLYAQTDRRDAGIEVIRRKRDQAPSNVELNALLAEHLNAATRYAEAVKILQELPASDQNTARILAVRGDAERGLKHYREAKAAYEAAITKDPTDTRSSQLLAVVSALLGEGDNSAIKEPIEPIAIPPELLSAADGAPTNATTLPATADPSDLELSGAYYVNRVIAVKFEPNKEMKETRFGIVKVLNERGVDLYNSLEFSFDPVAEQIFVNRLEVKDPAGNVVARGSVSDYYVIDQSAGDEVASQQKQLHVPIPGVKPGCTVEFMVTRRDLGSPARMRYVDTMLSTGVPCARSSLYFNGDPAGIGSFASESVGTDARPVTGGIAWSMRSVPPYRWEPLQPATRKFLPFVLLNDKAATWESEAREYIESIAARLEPSPEAKELAARVIAGQTSDEAKVAAIAAHVQRSYGYKAIEFGRRARVPQEVGAFIHNGFGDCKDHSLLLYHLLREAGVSARLSLASPGDVVCESTPSLDQFSHMLVYLPSLAGVDGKKRECWIDCTDKSANQPREASGWLDGSRVLILDPEAPLLAEIPPATPELRGMRSDREMMIQPNGDVVVKEAIGYSGATSAAMRDYLKEFDDDQRDRAARSLMSSAPDLLLNSFEVENLRENAVPLSLKCEYTLPRRFAVTGQEMLGAIPAVFETSMLQPEPVVNRRTPFERLPILCESKCVLVPPAGFELVVSKNALAAVKKHDELVEVALNFSESPGVPNQSRRLKVDFKLKVIGGYHPPKAYERYTRSMDEALGSLHRSVTLRRIDATPLP